MRVRRSGLVNPSGWSRNIGSAVEQGVAALLAEAQPGDPGAGGGGDRVGDGVQGGGSGDRVVVESLDAQQASVGGEADLPQGGQINQTVSRSRSHACR